MKKIILWTCFDDKENAKKEISKIRWGKLIKYSDKDGKYYFHSHFGYIQEVKIEINHWDLQNVKEKDYQLLSNLYLESIRKAEEINRKAPIGAFVPGLSEKGPIYSVITKYSYQKNNQSIFDVCAELFMRLLMAHLLTNGNKRVALVFLKLLLCNLGYYLKWTEGFIKNYSKHKEKVKVFTEKLTSKQNPDSDIYQKIKTEVSSWIQDSVLIGLYWKN